MLGWGRNGTDRHHLGAPAKPVCSRVDGPWLTVAAACSVVAIKHFVEVEGVKLGQGGHRLVGHGASLWAAKVRAAVVLSAGGSGVICCLAAMTWFADRTRCG